jgi:uncharacterized Zn-binding protein involved in type VI secretion
MGAFAVRIGDTTSDGGAVVPGPGSVSSKVFIEGMPASVLGDTIAWPSGQSTSIFPSGTTKVLIGGLPAIRMSDLSAGGTNAVKTATKTQFG